MHVVYATGQSHGRSFGISSTHEKVPAAGVVCAICHGKRSIRNLDDELLGSLTNEEFMRLARAVKRAIELELNPSSRAFGAQRVAPGMIRTETRRRHISKGLARVHRRRLEMKSEQALLATLIMPEFDLASTFVKDAEARTQ